MHPQSLRDSPEGRAGFTGFSPASALRRLSEKVSLTLRRDPVGSCGTQEPKTCTNPVHPQSLRDSPEGRAGFTGFSPASALRRLSEKVSLTLRRDPVGSCGTQEPKTCTNPVHPQSLRDSPEGRAGFTRPLCDT